MLSASEHSAQATPATPKSAAPLSVRPFQQSLPMLLMRAREAVLQRFRPNLRRHDVTEQQWRVLRVLVEQDGVEMLELAQRCSIQPPSLSRTIPLLVRRGWVRRNNGSDDQRRVVVKLTPKGEELVRVMTAESVQVYARLEAEIGSERLMEIERLLEELSRIASAAPDCKTPQ